VFVGVEGGFLDFLDLFGLKFGFAANPSLAKLFCFFASLIDFLVPSDPGLYANFFVLCCFLVFSLCFGLSSRFRFLFSRDPSSPSSATDFAANPCTSLFLNSASSNLSFPVKYHFLLLFSYSSGSSSSIFFQFICFLFFFTNNFFLLFPLLLFLLYLHLNPQFFYSIALLTLLV